jgi:hypothetical protein
MVDADREGKKIDLKKPFLLLFKSNDYFLFAAFLFLLKQFCSQQQFSIFLLFFFHPNISFDADFCTSWP